MFYVNGELFQIVIVGFWCQDKVIVILFDIVLLLVVGLVVGNQYKWCIIGGIFQLGCCSLFNEWVIELQCFIVRNQNVFIRLCYMLVE